MTTHQVISRFNLNLANLIIEDSQPTLSYEVDPKEEIFNLSFNQIINQNENINF